MSSPSKKVFFISELELSVVSSQKIMLPNDSLLSERVNNMWNIINT